MVRKVRPERVGMGNGGRVGVDCGFLRGSLLSCAPPRRTRRCAAAGSAWHARSGDIPPPAGGVKKSPTSDRRSWGLLRDGVVDVLGRLLPRVEDDLFPGVVRVQRGDDPLDRIVEQDRADAGVRHLALEFVTMGRLKKGSYWLTGLPLLLNTVQPAADPARGVSACTALSLASRTSPRLIFAAGHRRLGTRVAGFGLDLLLDLAAEAIGVGEADAGFWSAAGPGSAKCVSRASVYAAATVGWPLRVVARRGRRRCAWSPCPAGWPAASAAGRRQRSCRTASGRVGVEVFQQIAVVFA